MSELTAILQEWLTDSNRCLDMPMHLSEGVKDFIEYRRKEWYKFPKNKRPEFRNFVAAYLSGKKEW